MGTDIYGGIEIRNPNADEDWYTRPPWERAVDLYPLYSGRDYAAFGCLFGVRDLVGWEPVAAGRGLPPDVSPELRKEFDEAAGLDAAVHGPTWVTWAELARIDLDAAPADIRGALVLRDDRTPALEERRWVTDDWPPDVLDRLGPGPAADGPAATPFGEWRAGTTRVSYRRFTRRDAIGPGTGWEHVFAVMGALAGRFGDEHVRLVVYFD
ncbi:MULTISPECIES: hypothetical protein [Streptomyces]|uniref:hypothetical protein n=1 Tax=Streptomyces TaxID=1883 RepID=UPI00163C3AF7|nr:MULTISPECIES: hypothetical protein [Streptomyces]MBC2874236.1 hypothetical protein [Streptomyces sp. TYQ1024]UBI40274.1 hypothetical protein K7I03_30035 [Streptomyces mobaraensis]UKW32852.1 hypothetical protein MCU78_29960 [Streptomyces sp. TYQ1024]